MEVRFEGVTVHHPASGRTLLDGVSGELRARSISALMGASGSGKTTLLTTLGRRFDVALAYRGTVRYNGAKWRVRDKRRVAFVPQDDLYPLGLTVREHLGFSSRLRLDVDDRTRADRVESVIRKLRLEKCADTIIGGEGGMRGVSGGERKRACIANELLTEPSLLLCDEVTSGLDSALSAVVIDLLRDLVRAGNLTVCCTIHQPSSALFARFDELLALDEGRVFYRGPRADLVQWLGDIGRPCPPNFNTADALIDVLVLDDSRHADPRVKRVMDENAAFRPVSRAPDAAAGEAASGGVAASARPPGSLAASRSVIFNLGANVNPAAQERDEPEFAASFPTQVWVLLQRMFKKAGPGIFTPQTVLSQLGLALVASVLWWQLGYSASTVFLRASLCFWLVGTDSCVCRTLSPSRRAG